MKRRTNPVARALLWLWGSVFVALIFIASVPSLRMEAMYRIWSAQKWPETSSVRRMIVEGGSHGLNMLLNKGGLEHEVIKEALFDLSPAAYNALWHRLGRAQDPGERAIYETILANNRSDEIEASLIANTTHENPRRRAAAMRLAISAGVDPEDSWFLDKEAEVRAILVPHRLDPDSVDRYLADEAPVVREVLFQCVHKIDLLNRERQARADLMSIPGFNPEDPVAGRELAKVDRRIASLMDQVRTLSFAILDKASVLLVSTDEETVSRTIEVFGMIEVPEDVLAKCRPLIDHASPEIRRQAMMMLARQGVQEIATAIWDACRHDKEILVQLTAWEALRLLGPRSLVSELQDFVAAETEGSTDEKDKAFAVLEAMARPEDEAWFRQITEGYDPEFARRSMRILKRISGDR